MIVDTPHGVQHHLSSTDPSRVADQVFQYAKLFRSERNVLIVQMDFMAKGIQYQWAVDIS